MTVLLDMKPREVKLLGGHDFGRILRRLRRLRQIRNFLFQWCVTDQLPSLGQHRETELRFILDLQLQCLLVDIDRAQVSELIKQDGVALRETEFCIRILRGTIGDEVDALVGALQVDGRFLRCVLDVTDALIWHEVLREGLLLHRLEPGEIRLVIGIHTAHQLDVRAVTVGEVPIPGLSEIATAPGPLLLSRRNVMVCDMQEASSDLIIIAADEIEIGFLRHVRGRHRDVLIAGNVDALTVIMLIVDTGRDREAGNVALSMIHHGMHIRREDRLRVVIDRNGRIRPPEEGLRLGGPVVKLALDLDVGLARIEGEARLPAGTVHLIGVGDPAGLRTIRVLDQHVVHRTEGRRTVMLRPVELDTAADPRSAEADEGRLDHMIVVDEIVVVRLIVGTLDPTAELRQDHHLQILILEPDRMIRLILLFIIYFFDRRVRIDASGASLVDTLLQEHRILIRLADPIGRDHLDGFPNLYF